MRGLVPPRIGTARRRGRRTLGPLLVEIAQAMGLDPFPWQRHLSDVSLELRPRVRPGTASRRRLAAKWVTAVVPRQAGKTSWAAARVALQCRLPSLPNVADVAGGAVLRPQRVSMTAQDRSSALIRWRETVELIMASPLADDVSKVVLQRGEERLVWRNGSTYGIFTPSRTGSRGASNDLVIIDEALAHRADLLAAVSPTMSQRDSAVGCLGAQLVVISNAGDDRAELLNLSRELGRRSAASGDDDGRCYMEWSAPDDADPYDPAVWAAVMPTFDAPNGIATEYVRMEAESMDLADFRREYLCLHTSRPADRVIDVDAWAAAPTGEIDGQVVFAIDGTPGGTSAAIVVAGPCAAGVAVEVVDQRDGTEWIVEAVSELARIWSASVVVDAGGPLAWTIAKLEANEVSVVAAGAAKVLAAAAMLRDAVSAGRLAHDIDDRLTDAVAAAERRRSGDRWGFDRNGSGDVSPLVAASLAAWAVETGEVLQAMVW